MLLDRGANKPLVDDLTWRGEVVKVMPENPCTAQVIAIGDNGVSAASDPRKHGSPLVK
ncbi:MAG: hypothetical protein ABI627_00745 [Polyangiaceae bacterium]